MVSMSGVVQRGPNLKQDGVRIAMSSTSVRMLMDGLNKLLNLLFSLFQKMDTTQAYVCAGSRIYNVTKWLNCQGMRCATNTHKPSFQVNTSLMKQTSSAARGSGSGCGMPDETMTEEEFFEWLQDAVQSGSFDLNTRTERDSPR